MKNPKTQNKRLLSRREMLTLLGGTGGALLSGFTLNQFLRGASVSAQDYDYNYSHGNDVAPDYGIVFPDNLVNSIIITISPENWQAIQDDLTGLIGEFGSGGGFGGRGNFQPPADGELPEGFQPPADGELPEGFEPPEGIEPPSNGGRPGGGQFPGGDGFVGGLSFTETDPIWMPVTISFGDEIWENVGFRYKGNSTLNGAWTSGSLKIGFKLNFDKFEDDYPEIDNQRFFGFDELSFSSNYNDSSYLHEKVAADIFRNAGIPSARTAFYAVTLDYGEGQTYIGLYTAVEEVDDTVIQTQFVDDSGNLYKPEGTGASFMAGTFDEVSFEKKTNEDEADFSDILALFDALHAETRMSDPATWRSNLESILDVPEFLQWLAVNTVIQNWDTYGSMAHNYYLYNNPASGLLTWIPWDNNEALSGGRGFGGRGSNTESGSLDLSNTSNNWPLISFLVNDPVYHNLYVSYAEEAINTVFEPTQMTATFQNLHQMITPYVTGSATGSPDMEFASAQTFENTLTQLIEHVNQRYTVTQEYVNNQL